MVKCPFCGFANEDGALFCEQCKSDVSNVGPTASQPSHAPPTPMPDAPLPLAAEEPVLAALVEEAPAAKAEEPVMAALVEEPPVVAFVEEPKAEAPPAAAEVVEAKPAPPAEVASLPPAMEIPPPAAATPAAPAAKPAAGAQVPIPIGAQVKLQVQRGLKIGEEYSIYAGENFVGRADEKPVDVDLTFQEPEDRVWCSRQHALMVYDDATGTLTIEDLNSSNGTFVNRERVYPGQPRQLFVGNTVQIGTVHLKVKV
jgi:hypothetical protein